MGLFDKFRKFSAETEYEKIRNYLKPKDGNIHILMINSFSKWINQHFSCEEKYTVQMDETITKMQEDGYEIVDIKFTTLMNQGLFGEMEGFHTLILYK